MITFFLMYLTVLLGAIQDTSNNSSSDTTETRGDGDNIVIDPITDNGLGYLMSGLRAKATLQPLPCDCAHFEPLFVVQQHKEQITNYSELKCIGGRNFTMVRAYTFCTTEKLTSFIVSVCSTVVLFALFTLGRMLAERYASVATAYLYFYGCCLRCVRRRELIDKTYDVYVSFAEADAQFVFQELVPRLESSRLGLSLCVHHRDWRAGCNVLEEIERCVAASRCALLVLSRNFADSEWGVHEFRTAQLLSMERASPKILMVLLEEIPDDGCCPELHGYLATNTFIARDDPAFWQRLVYALPHKRVARVGRSFDTRSNVNKPKTVHRAPQSATRYGDEIPLNMLPMMPAVPQLCIGPAPVVVLERRHDSIV